MIDAKPRQPPRVVVLGGPNGAGKSTSANRLLDGPLRVDEFVNADSIAQELTGNSPEMVALAAGRKMLSRLRQLAGQHASFGFETTLASRSFAPWLHDLVDGGYEFCLVFLWLPSDDIAISRVAGRVRLGGHSVPEPTIRRRFRSGLKNFFELYQPLANHWELIDNSGAEPRLVAAGTQAQVRIIADATIWNLVETQVRDPT